MSISILSPHNLSMIIINHIHVDLIVYFFMANSDIVCHGHHNYSSNSKGVAAIGDGEKKTRGADILMYDYVSC